MDPRRRKKIHSYNHFSYKCLINTRLNNTGSNSENRKIAESPGFFPLARVAYNQKCAAGLVDKLHSMSNFYVLLFMSGAQKHDLRWQTEQICITECGWCNWLGFSGKFKDYNLEPMVCVCIMWLIQSLDYTPSSAWFPVFFFNTGRDPALQKSRDVYILLLPWVSFS